MVDRFTCIPYGLEARLPQAAPLEDLSKSPNWVSIVDHSLIFSQISDSRRFYSKILKIICLYRPADRTNFPYLIYLYQNKGQRGYCHG